MLAQCCSVFHHASLDIVSMPYRAAIVGVAEHCDNHMTSGYLKFIVHKSIDNYLHVNTLCSLNDFAPTLLKA
jgi:hypothetical protein